MGLVSILLFLGLVAFYWDNNRLRSDIGGLTARLEQVSTDCFALKTEREGLLIEIENQKENNSKVMSMKASQATRTGQIVENLIPLLTNLPYDPKNLHHLSAPIDYIYFDYDGANGPEIVFVECKSGGAKESKRQRLIKVAIQNGHVFYEQLRVNENGITVKRVKNED